MPLVRRVGSRRHNHSPTRPCLYPSETGVCRADFAKHAFDGSQPATGKNDGVVMSILQSVIRRTIEREFTPAQEQPAIERRTLQYEYKER